MISFQSVTDGISRPVKSSRQ